MEVTWIYTSYGSITGALVSGQLPRLGPGQVAMALVRETLDQEVLDVHATIAGQQYYGRQVLPADHDLHRDNLLLPAGLDLARAMFEQTPRQPWLRRIWTRLRLRTPKRYVVDHYPTDRLVALGQQEGQWGLFIWSSGLAVFVSRDRLADVRLIWETPDLLALQVSSALSAAQGARISDTLAHLTDTLMRITSQQNAAP